MKLKKIFIKSGSAIGTTINEWATINQLEIEEISFEEGFDKHISGLVLLHQNSDIDKESNDLRALFDKSMKPVQKIDINGTLMVGVSNFSLWLERNGCTNFLFLGAENLGQNPNLNRYLEALKIK